MENAFGILASRLRVLLRQWSKGQKVVRNIVFTCVVLHNMLSTRQGGVARTPTPSDNITDIVNETVVYMADVKLHKYQRRQSNSKTYSRITSIMFENWLGRSRGKVLTIVYLF